MELVNARQQWTDVGSLTATVPEAERKFPNPPGWSNRKAFTYLLNNVELLHLNFKALERGRKLDVEMLNNILGQGRLQLADWGSVEEIRREREARIAARERIETLVADSNHDGVNRGTVYVRNLVVRATFHFAQYVDYRYSDPVYPDASPGRFQVMECLLPDCGKLFIRDRTKLLYCSDDCARKDQ